VSKEHFIGFSFQKSLSISFHGITLLFKALRQIGVPVAKCSLILYEKPSKYSIFEKGFL
jgi:hypothetical protein